MTEKSKIKWIYIISLAFIVGNAILIINDFYWGNLFPVLLFILFLYFVSLDKILLLITFLTPLAITLRDSDLGIGVSLPTEPLMFGVLVFFIIKVLFEGKYDSKVLKYPVTVAIIVNLVWIFFTSITSEIPLVSFKFLLSRLWFVVPFYFLGVLLFKNIKTVRTFLWLYIVPLTAVIIYTIYNHSLWGFGENPGHWVMTPFYNDHTAYGAVLAMFIPVLTGFFIDKKFSVGYRTVSGIFLGIFLVALVLSYSRAAWLSVFFAFVIFIIILFKIKFRWIFLSALLFLGLFFAFQKQIIMELEKNKQDSSANFTEHVQSSMNITSDASNLERLNRWHCALRMFAKRPLLGWGPGTYQFLYAPFQSSDEKTIISTNAGDRGNAHSEYIGPLAEMGIIGSLSVIVLFSLVVYRGITLYNRFDDKSLKILSLSITLGLITYFIHGFLNNFLDTDKASVPFWGFIAIIAALDLFHYHSKQKRNNIME